MKFLKSAVTTIALAFLLTAGIGETAIAQDKWPTKPLSIVVSFKAGGNADIVARMNAEALSKELGVPVNVLNKPGGAHIPATMFVLKAPADGYTLFNWSPPSFMVVPLTRKVPYKPLRDFIPLFAESPRRTLSMCEPIPHTRHLRSSLRAPRPRNSPSASIT